MGEHRQYKVYGDSAYYPDTHMRSRHDYGNLTEREVLENKAMSSCRESIQWGYGELKSMWAFVDFQKNLKLRKQKIPNIFLTAMILRNAYVTMNVSKSSEFF